MDCAIFLDWTKQFIGEISALREGGKFLLLFMDGCPCDVQFEFLILLRKHGIIAIRPPSHTSHVLQPLDVSVYSSFKAHFRHEFLTISRSKKKFNAFDVLALISAAYSSCAT